MNEALKGMNLDKIGPMLRGECEWGGRDRKRWKRLIIFYTLYYIGIFGLFFLVVYWFNLGTQSGSDGKIVFILEGWKYNTTEIGKSYETSKLLLNLYIMWNAVIYNF